MNDVFAVMRQEIVNTITSRSYQITAVGVPLISVLIFLGVSYANRNAPDALEVLVAPPEDSLAQGFVDPAGWIRAYPPEFPEERLMRYQDEAAARTALGAGEIGSYYVIPEDFLTTGEIAYIRPDFNPLSAFDQTFSLEWLLEFNLLDQNVEIARRVDRPMIVDAVFTGGEAQPEPDDSPWAFFIPYGVTMVFYVVILMSSSFLLSSVTREKENSVIEILLSSITARELLSGKILGLGLMGLAHAMLWVGTGYALLQLSGRTLDLPPGLSLPPSILVWGMVFFLLGYAVYASLMAGLGALVPSMREASQATFVIILPLIIPLMFIGVMIEAPNDPLAIGLSLFPLTAPVTMMTRLAADEIPIWQPVLAALLLILTAIWIVRLVAGMFRAQTLLSGESPSLRGLLRTLAGRS